MSLTTILLVACATTEPVPFYKPAPYSLLGNFGLSAAAFSPSGRLAAVANYNAIWILDTASMKHRAILSGHERFGTNNTLAFLDDERIVTTARAERPGADDFQAAIKIWRVDDPLGDPAIIKLPELGRYAITLRHSGTTGAIAVGGYNGAVVVLKPDGDEHYSKIQLPGLDGPVLALAFSEDGDFLAAGGDHPAVPIWNLPALSQPGILPVDGVVYDLDLVPGKQTLLVTGKDLRLWKFRSNETPLGVDSPSLAGDYIIIGAMMATYVVLAAAAAAVGGYAAAPPPMSSNDPYEPDYGFCARETAVSPDGDYVADVHRGKLKEKIRVVDLSQNTVAKKLNPKGGDTCGVAFHPDGTKLLIANHRIARLYDTRTWDFEDFDQGPSCVSNAGSRKSSCVID